MKLALILLSLFALQTQEPKTLSLNYVEGTAINAQVLAVTGDSVRLKVFVLGGHMQITRRLADFVPLSVFQIEMAANPPSGFDGHFKKAQRAAELRLLPQAGVEGRAAIEAVKSTPEAESKKKEVRSWAADTLELMVKEAVAQDRLADARYCLKLLSTRLSDLRTEEQLDALAASVSGLGEQQAAKRDNARQANLDAKARDKVNSTMQKIQQGIAAGDKLQREAISKSRSTVASTNLCEKAVGAYKSAWKSLQEVMEKNSEDVELMRTASGLAEQLHDNAIRTALHAANMMTVQSDYKGAMEWANRILAFDPENAEAKEMVTTIQLAAAAASGDWDWRWRAVGGTTTSGHDPRKY